MTCDDNGTPTDPSDDPFTYVIEVTGANTGSTYNITGDDVQNGLAYGVQNGPFGPFNIADGDLDIVVVDGDDASCTEDATVVAPETCSDECDLDPPVIVATCDDNGTPTDPSDDFFTYTIQVTGDNTGGTYSISGDDTQSGLAYGVVNGPFGPFPIADGDLSITITDSDDPTCNLIDIAVNAPASCSDECDINEPQIIVTCDDNGTPTDPSDDTFTYVIEVTGANTGSTYNITGDDVQNGLAYGVQNGPFGPFNIADGDLDIVVVDGDDATCTEDATVVAPETCSDECDLDPPVIVATCDDNGTPTDPSDDFFTYTILVTGDNTGGTYSISGDDTQSGLSYGVVNGPFGPFDIAAGDLNLNIQDSDDATCTIIGVPVNAPQTCSDECDINEPQIIVTCDDNGTPTDPSDDTFTYVIEVTGANTGSTYNITGDDVQNGLAYGVQNGPFGPFNIADGDLDIVVVDGDDATCTEDATVVAPETCSDECDLDPPVIVATCDDNGTPTDPTDDFFTYTIQVTGDNTGGTYSISGDDTQSGLAYGVVNGPFGPFPIADGDLSINITDSDDPLCELISVAVNAPATCSDECDINEPQIIVTCDDNGTPTDPSDDTFTYVIEVTGANTGSTYNITGDDVQNGLAYGVQNGPFGPFNIADGDLDIVVVDGDDATCTEDATIVAPETCSDECDLDPPVIVATCDDNGTPTDPSDDTFTYTILVTGDNTGGTYSISGDDTQSGLSYGVVNGPFGPFDIAAGDLNLNIQDSDDATCTIIGVPVNAPQTCSDECDINEPQIIVTCDDNGTPTDPSDDTFTYVIEVTGANTGSTYNITGDDVQNGLAYGVQNGPFGPFNIADGDLDIVVVDGDDATCTEDATVVAPETCSDECDLDPPVIVATCDDNGTPTDPTDDFFTYTIQVTGDNTGGTYSISGDDTQSGLAYGVVNGPFGPFPIADGDLSINITDSDDPLCELISVAVNAPATCSDECDINEPQIIVTCDDNGTPTDPTDDTFTYVIEVTGANTGSTYNITGDDVQNGLAYGVQNGPFGPFNIADGDLDIVVVDGDDATCTEDATIVAPETCSDECDLDPPVIVATCDDNGTPTDPSDDTFTYTILVTGDNTGGTYSISGDDTQSGLAYDVVNGPFGPFDIAAGDLNLNIQDSDDATCTIIGVPVNAPQTCSDDCDINTPQIIVTCDDNGTPTDPTDDTFTYVIEVTGANTGSTYNITGDDSQSGLAYGVQNGPFGPFNIADGDLDIVVVDGDDATCTEDATVVAPETCSDECDLDPPVIVATCDDNGTPTDPSDDFFTYTIQVTGDNTGGTYSISGDDTQSGLAYGVVNGPFGPFPIADGDLSINITDSDDPLCGLISVAVNAPATCSDECDINAPQIIVTCDDNGTPTDPSDDTFTYVIEVTGANTGSTYNITGDDVQNGLAYGVQNGPFGPFNIADGDLDIVVVDGEDATCTEDATIVAPETCSDECDLDPPVIVATCDDNGTPTDPTDDTFTYTILVTGDNTGGTYSISGDDTQSGLAYDVVNGPFGPFDIAAGDLNLNIQDSDDATCTIIGVPVNAPQTCSDDCDINTPQIIVTCDDNGTPTDPSDDTFTYVIEVTGANTGSTYNITGDDSQTGLAYGVQNGPFGPFNIADGDLDIVVVDGDDANCTEDATVVAPETCSGDCDLDPPVIVATCDDNGTPTDPTDDTFTYTIIVTGDNTGGTYSISGDDTQSGLAYGVVNGPFGPFPIADGDLSINITDSDDPLCELISVAVNAPATCSDECEIAPPTISTFCDDNGTPDDPSDDVFFYTVEVVGVNTGSTFNITGDDSQTGLIYGIVNGPFGPFDIAAGDLNITLEDGDDASCTEDALVEATAPCSDECDLDPPVIVVKCLDNGTPNDPSDDLFEYYITVTGANTGATYSISGDDVQTGLPYDVENGPFGPFPIASGNLEIFVTDDSDPACQEIATIVPPAPCSNDCEIDDVIITTECDDNGTPINPNDDTYTYVITVIGSGTGTTYNISGDDTQTGLTYNVANGPFGPFPITGGDLDIVITDNDDPNCTEDAEVEAPISCSDDCNLEEPIIVVNCDDNNTPDDPTDDTFTYSILVNGSNTGTGYNISGDDSQNGLTYGEFEGPFGPFDIADGDLVIQITDTDNEGCGLEDVLIAAPAPCSDDCTINTPIVEVDCSDNGTPDDPSDDTYTFTLLVTGNNTGGTFDVGGELFIDDLPYGTVNGPFGPFLISQGDLELTIIDNDDTGCTRDFTVNAPNNCSPLCSILQPAIGTICDDNGTPDDPTDDVFFYQIFVLGNNTSATYNITGGDFQQNLQYGQLNGPFGPFPISGGTIYIDVVDSGNPSCRYDNAPVVPPNTCSFECAIYDPIISTNCDDNGTPDDPTDDLFTFSILVDGNSTGNSYSISGDYNAAGLTYGVVNGPFGPFPIANGDLNLFISDDDNAGCELDDIIVTPPANCVPNDAAIGNYVWEDLDGDGIQDDNEPGIPGVLVTLTGTDVFGNPVTGTMTTDMDGFYLFTGLTPGIYKLTFQTPTGFISTEPNVGTDDAVDSDADPLMGGMTNFEVLSAGETNLTYDAGYIRLAGLGNYVWEDIDGDGEQDPNEPGIPNVEVVLTGFDGNGNFITQITFTDNDGFYLFDNLPPGSYKVTFIQPGGYEFTGLDAIANDSLDSDADPNMNGMTVFEDLTSGELNLTYDAGLYIPAGIGDFVWSDFDGDGEQDPNEPGIPDVIVTLTGINGLGEIVVLADTTDANGNYSFPSLHPGDYKLTFETPDGYTITTLDATGDDTNDSDANPAMGGMTVFENLVSGEYNPNYDAGYVPDADLAAIGDFVWEDTNANGQQDIGEPGIPNVTVNLTGTDENGNPVNETTTTNANGFYLFDNLQPGMYQVTFVAPTGFTFTTMDATGDDTNDSDADETTGTTPVEDLMAGEINLTYDAGFIPQLPASIGDYVWEDLNGNGQQEVGEPGIPNVTVILTGTDENGNPVNESTTTDANGFYLFDDLVPGMYQVTFVAPTGYVFTGPDATGDDTNDSDADPATGQTPVEDLMAGENNLTYDAGLYQPASIGDYTWIDLDQDGIQDPDEPGLGEIEVTLTGTDGLGNPVSMTMFTDGDGLYLFDNLVPGTYKLTFGTYNGYDYTALDSGNDDTIDSDADPDMGGMTIFEELTSGEMNTTYDAGYFEFVPGSIGNYVWEDLDGDGQQDPNEPGVDGVVVNLTGTDTNGNPVDLTTTTSNGGFYIFDNLHPGEYKVTFELPAGFLFTAPDATGDDTNDSDALPDMGGMTVIEILEPGENNLDYDAGLIPDIPATIGNYVWEDFDGDGQQDANEPGIPDVMVTLTGTDGAGNPVTLTTTTDAFGFYEFTDITPGVYKLTFAAIPGFEYTAVNATGDDTNDSDADPNMGGMTDFEVLSPGEVNLDYDAGYYEPASIGDFAWVDENEDGIQDPNEPGLPNVKVTLTGTTGNGVDVMLMTFTGPTGYYEFEDLVPGMYKLTFDLPSGYEYTDANVGFNDSVDSDADGSMGGMTEFEDLTSGESNTNYDAGYTPIETASISDKVWDDMDMDGIQDPDEPGVEGVQIYLYDCADMTTPIDSTMTAADGTYIFDGLVPGEYKLQFILPAGYNAFSPSNQGGDDDMDSDANQSTGFTDCYELEEGENDTSADVGVTNCPPLSTIQCLSDVEIALDNKCEAIITPELVLDIDVACYQPLDIMVIDPNGFIVTNMFDVNDIGITYTVIVTDPVTGASCSTTVTIVDDMPPVIICPDETYEISCTDDLNTLPAPVAADNCTTYTMNLVSTVTIDDDPCDDNITIIVREWVAVDAYGNMSEACFDTVIITRPDALSVDFPDDITWTCTEYNEYPTITDATPVTGELATTGSGTPTNIDAEACNYDIDFSDQIIDNCGGSFDIIRTWVITDWCTGNVVTSNNNGEDNIQVISIVDNDPPTVSIDPLEMSVDPGTCTAQGMIPIPVVSDDCSDWTIQIFTPLGEAIYLNGQNANDGALLPAPGLEIGSYIFTYEVEDACGNLTSVSIKVNVIDEIPPVAVCIESTVVFLANDGIGVLSAEVFDDGSFDNCCVEGFQVRRLGIDCDGNDDSPYGPFVTFCCEDVDNSPVLVELQVIDCFGNTSTCQAEVYVEGEGVGGPIECPDDVTISCVEYTDGLGAWLDVGVYDVLNAYGTIESVNNACPIIEDYTVSVNLDMCFEGTITRTWIALDANGQPQTCTQVITVEHISDFVVSFPADTIVNCNDLPLGDVGEPQVFFGECELIATTFEDIELIAVGDACSKIVRTWAVVNWCLYDEYGYDAFIELSEAEAGIDFDGDGDMDEHTFQDGVTGTGQNDGYIEYTQVIKVIDTDQPEFDVEDFEVCTDENCLATVELPIPDVIDCSDNITIGIITTLPNGTGFGPYTDVPVGTYTALYNVTDNCGNITGDLVTIEVVDCEGPSALCVDVVTVFLDQDGNGSLNPNMLDDGSFDNGCDMDDVILTFGPDPADTIRYYGCPDLGQFAGGLYVTGPGGVQDSCMTMIMVQDTTDACGGFRMVGGFIEMEDGEMVQDVLVDVNDGYTSEMTPADGWYDFELEAGGDYTIAPYRNDNATNGVTTLDLVLVQKHILNLQVLDSPYKIIAADANNSGTVTSLDMVILRKMILLLQFEFPNNTSWRFIDKDYEFPVPSNPWYEEFPEVVNYNDLAEDDPAADFIAVKIGDVNHSATANNLVHSDDRNFGKTWNLKTQNRSLIAGEQYQLDFTTEDLDVEGYQFTLEFDPDKLSVVEFVPGMLQVDNVGFTLLPEGAVTFSWNDFADERLEPNTVLFSLIIEANDDGWLSDQLEITNRFTAAEAYTEALETMNVALEFGDAASLQVMELYQNRPNPFKDQTTIGFRLAEKAEATIVVTNIHGQILRKISGNYDAGYHEVTLNDFDVQGVLYYTLKTEDQTITRKMVAME